MEIRNIIRSLIEEKLSESSNSLNDVVWSKNVIKPGTKTSVTKKYKAGDKVKYAGKILTVVSHDDNGFITLSNPEWSKNRIVPHTAVSSIKESLDEASDRKLDKAMAIINARITKPGQPPKYPSFDSAPEDIKAAAKNLAKNMK